MLSRKERYKEREREGETERSVVRVYTRKNRDADVADSGKQLMKNGVASRLVSHTRVLASDGTQFHHCPKCLGWPKPQSTYVNVEASRLHGADHRCDGSETRGTKEDGVCFLDDVAYAGHAKKKKFFKSSSVCESQKSPPDSRVGQQS